MVSLTSLWLPIVLSAVAVFIASSIIHMVLRYHNSDHAGLPGEEKILETMRSERVAPGSYFFPFSCGKDMRSPEVQEKFEQGPVGMMTVIPNGPPAMGKYLAQWFVYCLFVSFFLAYIASRTVEAGAEYLEVFRVVGTVGFLAYGFAHISNTIWKGQRWGPTLKDLLDALIYGAVTAGVFGWLWP